MSQPNRLFNTLVGIFMLIVVSILSSTLANAAPPNIQKVCREAANAIHKDYYTLKNSGVTQNELAAFIVAMDRTNPNISIVRQNAVYLAQAIFQTSSPREAHRLYLSNCLNYYTNLTLGK